MFKSLLLKSRTLKPGEAAVNAANGLPCISLKELLLLNEGHRYQEETREKEGSLYSQESLPHVQDVELNDRCETYSMRASEVTEDEPGIGKLLGNMEAARIMPLQNHAVPGLCSVSATKFGDVLTHRRSCCIQACSRTKP